MTVQLGRLERVDLRDAWATEASDFTPWLAQEQNIAILGDAIGMDLEVEAQEKEVGPFRADVLCKDTANGTWVLIENQLERTDHGHLGQLLTYAAGLKAVTIVWIAARFTDEHRAALDWLNESTIGDINFFGLEVELWRIGDSPVAPKFNVVCQPNDWSQTVAVAAKGVEAGELTTAKQLQFEFWTSFRDFILERGSFVRLTKPYPQPWITAPIGRTGFLLLAVASTWNSATGNYDSHEARVELVMNDAHAKSYFDQLQSCKAEIENALGEPLCWAEQPGKKQSKIYVRRDADFDKRELWPSYQEWLLSYLEKFHKVFQPRIKTLVAAPDDVPESSR
jgi:Domain of unknown function (DUF4268)